jgi:hypothetical protein
MRCGICVQAAALPTAPCTGPDPIGSALSIAACLQGGNHESQYGPPAMERGSSGRIVSSYAPLCPLPPDHMRVSFRAC